MFENVVKDLLYKLFVVLYCDFDKFKGVNDIFGYVVGDIVIKVMVD